MRAILLIIVLVYFSRQTNAAQPLVAVLRVYKSDNFSSHLCYYLSPTQKLDPLLTTEKMKLVNLISSINNHANITSSSLAISVKWNDFNDAEILSINPKLLIIVYDGQLIPKLKLILASHKLEVFNRSLVFLDNDQFNDIINGELSRQQHTNETLVSVFPFISNTLAYKSLIFILLYGFAITSILLGAWMIIASREDLGTKLNVEYGDLKRDAIVALVFHYKNNWLISTVKLLQLQDFIKNQTILPKYKFSLYLSITVCLAAASIFLLLTYFFYDVFVYILIALFALGGANAISNFLTFFIQRIVPSTTKTLTINVNCCQITSPRKIYIISAATFPIGVAIAITWLVFRNNEMIGWPLQSIIGMLLVAAFISSVLIIPSLKVGTLLLAAFLIYDVFFVFITPLFTSTATNVNYSSVAVELTRVRRSDGHSYMEALAY
ncbi:unnamed protein product [Schistosoma turkestanicum]|nr:unnamed protein product [Schistosoma turkestanicum]